MRPFYLFRRENGVIYVQFLNEAMHRRTTAKSTHESNMARAMTVVCDWMQNGIPVKGKRQTVASSVAINNLIGLASKNQIDADDVARLSGFLESFGYGLTNQVRDEHEKVRLVDHLTAFWDYDTSPYVLDKVAHDYDIGKRHCSDMVKRVSYWKEFFGDAFFEDVTTERLREFEIALKVKNLAGATRNYIMLAGKTAYKWAYENKKIKENPCVGLKRYNAKKTAKDRGVLTMDEAKAIFKITWDDERARVASLVAMTTGLRQGEIRALRACDIGEDRLYVRHNWENTDGLKSPKNGHTRELPLLPNVRDALKALVLQNKHEILEADKFVFWGSLPDKPIVENLILEGFKDALEKIGITEEVRVTRNIVFHSWRHFFGTTLSMQVNERQTQLALGHMTAAMTKHYIDHKTEEDLAVISKALDSAFGSAA
jgi:integrase